MLFAYMKSRFSLSYRDLEEIMMIRVLPASVRELLCGSP